MSLALVVNAGQVERVGATTTPEVLEVREGAGAGIDVTAAGAFEIGVTNASSINSGSGTVRWTHTGILDHERASSAEGGINIAELIELNSTGTGAETASIIVGDGNPNGNVTSGLAGSLFLDGANGAAYVKTDDTSAWTDLGGAGSTPTLDTVITGGTPDNDVNIPSANPVIFRDNAVAGFDVFAVVRTAAGAGAGIDISMGASTTDDGLGITMTTGAAGDAIRVTDGTEEIRFNLTGIINSQATTYATDDNAAADGSNGFQITTTPGAGADSPGGGTAAGVGGNNNNNAGTGGVGGAGANEFGGNGGQALLTGGIGGAGGGVGAGSGGTAQALGGTGASADATFAGTGGLGRVQGGTGGAGSGAVAGGAGGGGEATGGTGGVAGTGDAGPGGDFTIRSGDAGGVGGGTTGAQAGDIILLVGTSTGNNDGGAISATSGAGSSAAAGGDGGNITHTTGDGAESTGAAAGGNAGDWNVVTGDGGIPITGFSAGDGGDATFTLGDSTTVVAGAAALTGGSFVVNAGNASSPTTAGIGGSITLNAGDGDGTAGVVAITGGDATGSATGGNVTCTAGAGGTGNAGGIFSGVGGTSTGTGGAARLIGGAGTTVGGAAIILPGAGATDGDVQIGTSNTNAITSGNATDDPLWAHAGTFSVTTTTTPTTPLVGLTMAAETENAVDFGEFIRMTNTGATTVAASILVGDASPNGNVNALTGSLFLDAAAGAAYVNTDGATAWTDLGAGGATPTLDTVITGGTPDNDVSVPSANPIIFRDGGVADFTVMSIITTATDTVAAHGLLISMGAQKDGDALNVTNAGDGAAIFANNTGAGNALQVQDGGSDVLAIDSAGAVAITPTTGQSFQAAADATDLTAAVDLDGTAGASLRSTSAGTATAGDVELSSESTAAGSTAGNVLVGSFASAGTAGGLELRAGGTAFGAPVEGEINIVATDTVDIDAADVTMDTTGSISLDAVTTLNATVTGNSAGATDVDIVATNAGAGTGNVSITADDDIFFDARGAAAPIPFNESGDVDLDAGFTASSIVGALNELLGGQSATTEYAGTVNGTTAISAGEAVALMNDGGNPRVFQADANAGDQTENAVGLALAGAATGAAIQVVVAGEVPTPDAAWTGGVPATTNVGDPVFVSDTAGLISLTAPGGTSRVLKIGVVSFGGTGAVRVMVNAPDSIKL